MLDQRAQDVLFSLVDAYLETRAPVGSVSLVRRLGIQLSAATVRSVMADLEESGFITSPHTSAGRVPTDQGFSFVAESFLRVRDLSKEDKEKIDAPCLQKPENSQQLFQKAVHALSGLASCAGIIAAPKRDKNLTHIEFVPLTSQKALVVIVTEDDQVENRILELPPSVKPFHLERASNYLKGKIQGRCLKDVQDVLKKALQQDQDHMDRLSASLVRSGLSLWPAKDKTGHILVEGYGHLLENVAQEELDALSVLVKALEAKEGFLKILDQVAEADSIQIFVGSDNQLFQSSRCSAVLSPYKGPEGQVVGAVGVVGPTAMHYRRIIPLVDYTARLLGRILGHDDSL